MCSRYRNSIATLLMLFCTAAAAQVFTVASVRENTIDDPYDPRYIAAPEFVPKRFGERILMRNRLGDIIAWSFSLQDKNFELISDSEILDLTFEIEAIAGESATDDDLRAMFRSLLEDRFQLKTRRERRETGLYEMTVSRGGLKMTTAPQDQQRTSIGFGGPASWIELTGKGKRLRGVGASLDELAVVVGRKLSAPVRNRTGVNGAFNYDVVFSDGVDDLSNPSLIAALGDLGLRIQRANGFIDVLRIEHVERPSQN